MHKNRNRVPTCQAATGTRWSSMNRNRTGTLVGVKFHHPHDELVPVPPLHQHRVSGRVVCARRQWRPWEGSGPGSAVKLTAQRRGFGVGPGRRILSVTGGLRRPPRHTGRSTPLITAQISLLSDRSGLVVSSICHGNDHEGTEQDQLEEWPGASESWSAARWPIIRPSRDLIAARGCCPSSKHSSF